MDIDELDSNQSTLRWDQYLRIALQYKWLIIICTILGLATGIILAKTLPRVYRAYSLIMVEEGKILNPLMGNIAVAVDPAEKIREIQHEILSWPRLVDLIERLGMDKEIKDQVAYERLVDHLKNKINVDFKDKANTIVSISYEGQDPKRAQAIVATLAEIMLEKNTVDQNQDADSAISFISKQLEHYRKKLENTEAELAKFEDIYKVQMPVIAKLNDQLVDLQIQLHTLLIENTEQHPAVIAIKKKMAQIEGEIARQSKALVAKGINVNDKKYLEMAESLPKQQQEYARLVRDKKVNESLYQMMLQKFESAKISKQLEGNDETTKFKVLEPARLPMLPIKPDVNRVIMIATALGLCFSIGIIFLREMMNPSFKSVEEVKHLLGGTYPILGTISVIECDRDELPGKEA